MRALQVDVREAHGHDPDLARGLVEVNEGDLDPHKPLPRRDVQQSAYAPRNFRPRNLALASAMTATKFRFVRSYVIFLSVLTKPAEGGWAPAGRFSDLEEFAITLTEKERQDETYGTFSKYENKRSSFIRVHICGGAVSFLLSILEAGHEGDSASTCQEK